MRGIVGWGRAGGVCSICSCSVQCLRRQSQGWWEGGVQPLSQILGVGSWGVLTHLLSEPIKSIGSDREEQKPEAPFPSLIFVMQSLLRRINY